MLTREGSRRVGASVPWVLTTVCWAAVIGAAAFYFLQWYGTVGVLVVVLALLATVLVTRFRYPLLIWAIAGLAVGNLMLVSLVLLAISRSG